MQTDAWIRRVQPPQLALAHQVLCLALVCGNPSKRQAPRVFQPRQPYADGHVAASVLYRSQCGRASPSTCLSLVAEVFLAHREADCSKRGQDDRSLRGALAGSTHTHLTLQARRHHDLEGDVPVARLRLAHLPGSGSGLNGCHARSPPVSRHHDLSKFHGTKGRATEQNATRLPQDRRASSGANRRDSAGDDIEHLAVGTGA